MPKVYPVTDKEYHFALDITRRRNEEVVLSHNRQWAMQFQSKRTMFLDCTPDSLLCELYTSIRLTNGMKAAGINIEMMEPIRNLKPFSIKNVLKFRNIGKVTINELIQLYFAAGVPFEQ